MILNAYLAVSRVCNLRCRYCYLPEENKAERERRDELAESGVEAILAKAQAEGVQIGNLALHGAEPTMLSPETVGRIARAISDASGRQAGMQTNGTILTDKYLDRLVVELGDPGRLRIGVTIDGPAVIHDINRQGSYEKAMAGFRRVLERDLPTYILTGASADTARHLTSFNAWCAERVQEGHLFLIKPVSGELSMDPEQQFRFGQWLFTSGVSRNYAGLVGGMCVNRGNGCHWFELDMAGGVFPCNTGFAPAHRFGDWKRDSFAELAQKRAALFAERAQSPLCGRCPARGICNSGCPLERAADGLAADCGVRQSFYRHMAHNGFDYHGFVTHNSAPQAQLGEKDLRSLLK